MLGNGLAHKSAQPRASQINGWPSATSRITGNVKWVFGDGASVLTRTWIPQLTANRNQYPLDKFENCRILGAHLLGESATKMSALFCGFLTALLLFIKVQSASSSRLARKPQKRTFMPVRLRIPG